MFENIIGQPHIVHLLKHAVEQKNLPNGFLFVGNTYTAKLTTALELARVLACTKQRQWQCSCELCQMHRLLISPYTVMLGNRPFMPEIIRCSETFLQYPQESTFFLYLRSLRKLIRRFDTFLWEEDDSRYKKAKPLLAQINEIMDEDLAQIMTYAPDKQASVIYDIQAKMVSLASILEGYSVNIGQIRMMSHWAQTTAGHTKMVIIEEADRLAESPRNALLKILEEPPQNMTFVLSSTSRSAILPTILSRVRSYRFLPRTKEDQGAVISRVFRHSSSTPLLYDFFMQTALIDCESIAEKFLLALVQKQPFHIAYEKNINDTNFDSFLHYTAQIIQQWWHSGQLSRDMAIAWLHDLSMMRHQFLHYHQSIDNLLEGFFYHYLATYKHKTAPS